MWFAQLGRALNEADSLRAENALLWQLIEDAAQIISDLQDALDAQRKLLTTYDPPVMVTDYGYEVISTIAQVNERLLQDEP